jgi:hypothetical protein
MVGAILKRHFNSEFPNFMSLDIEGRDFQILQSIDFDKYCTNFFCFEAPDYSPVGAGRTRN